MIRVIHKWVQPTVKVSFVRKPKPYQRAAYLIQKVQIDVRFVPAKYICGAQMHYQYTVFP